MTPPIKLGWFVVAERVIVDSQTNSISVIHCIEQVTAPQLPTALVGGFTMAAYWYREDLDDSTPIDTKIRFGTVNPLGEEVELQVLEVDGATSPRFRTLARIPLMLKHYGVYMFKVYLPDGDGGWAAQGELPLVVLEGGAALVQP